MALRDLLRRAPGAAQPSPVDVHPDEALAAAWPSPPAAAPAADTASDWTTEPGFAAVAVEERPAEAPGDWTAAAEPVDVTDHTIELPALAAASGPGRRRVMQATLTLALVLACAGAALAASGVLRKKDEMPAPVRIGAASSIATKSAHHPKATPVKRAHHPARHRARRHRRAHRHAAVAPAHVVAAAPAAPAPARVAPVSHHVVTSPAPRPAPTPVAAPKPAPKPVATKPTTTAAQPAPSAPSGEAGRQPPPTS